MLSSTTSPPAADTIAGALMLFPYGQWIPMTAAAAHVRAAGLPGPALTSIVRRGRRHGQLLTRPTPGMTFVKRVWEPHAAAPS
ncbi:hypothetical protein [Streptomyces sp. NPDC001635]